MTKEGRWPGARAIALPDRLLRLDEAAGGGAARAGGATRRHQLDLENLAEEVESLGRSDLNIARNQSAHHRASAEARHSPASEPRIDWRGSVAQARDEVEDQITASMFTDVAADLDKLFGEPGAMPLRTHQHGEREAAHALPGACPYSFEQIVDQDWYPPNRHGVRPDRRVSA